MDINFLSQVRAYAFDLNDLIVSVFNKEGIAIFCIVCIMIFSLASLTAYWAFKNEQFKDIEGAKFEMLED